MVTNTVRPARRTKPPETSLSPRRRRFRASRSGPVAVLVLLCAVFTACGSEEEFDLAPLKVAEDLTLSYWMPLPSGVSFRFDMNTHYVYQELEEVTGVRIEFSHPLANQAGRQLELLLESDDTPDIMEWNWLAAYPGGPQGAIDDGMIQPLSDLVIQHAPNLFKILSEDEMVLRSVTTPGGELYAFPHLNSDRQTRSSVGLVIRRDWLDRIALPVPETIDEWRNMMLTMRDTDFETPGRGSEYPFFFPVFSGFDEDRPTYFFLEEANPFAGAWGVSHGLYRDTDGRVLFGPIQPGYRDMLVELNGWFEEGLIHPMLAEPESGRSFFEVVAKGGATMGSNGFLSFLRPIEYVPAPPPSLDGATEPLGAELAPVYDPNRAAAISPASPHASEAVRWLDVAYGEWGKRLFNFGVADETYTLEDGSPMLLDQVAESWARAFGNNPGSADDSVRVTRALMGGPFEQAGALVFQLKSAVLELPEGGDPWERYGRPEADAVLRYDPGRFEEFNRIMEPVVRHARENFAAFVTGQRRIEEFERFVDEIRELGVNEAISLLYTAESEFYSKPAW